MDHTKRAPIEVGQRVEAEWMPGRFEPATIDKARWLEGETWLIGVQFDSGPHLSTVWPTARIRAAADAGA